MGRLRYTINVMLGGSVDHRAAMPTEDLHAFASESLGRADALLFGRVTYRMMEDAWRLPLARAVPEWMLAFAETIDAARKYVVSSTLDAVDWNAELIDPGDLSAAVRELKASVDGDVLVSGWMLPTALARLGLIDDYEFYQLPRVAGGPPHLLAGVGDGLDLDYVGCEERPGGAVVLRYRTPSAPAG